MVNLKIRIEVFITLLIVVSYISVIKFVNPFLLVVLLFITIWNLYNVKLNKKVYINRHILTFIGLLSTVYIFYNTTLNSFLSSLLQIVTIFISIKLIEDKRYRDYMQIILLSIFVITISGLFNLALSFIVYIVISIFIINATVIFLTIYDKIGEEYINKNEFYIILKRSTLIPILAIPLSIIIFIILPRTNTPLFEFLSYSNSSKSGFTNNITLGAVSSIQEDNRIAFRVKMKEIDLKDLYWRGIVFDLYKDGKWESSKNKDFINISRFKKNRVVEYEVYLEPTGEKYFLMLDKPVSIEIDKHKVKVTEDFEFISDTEITKKRYYKGYSVISNYLYDDFSDIENSVDTTYIPENVKRFAKRFYNNDPFKIIYGIMGFFQKDFRYSLYNLPTGKDSLEQFLFEKKVGNCEYFASAMALLLRSNGLPSRLVGGYLGGYYNRDIGYYLVANKNAHVWVEVLINDRWYRVDPTPAALEMSSNRGNLPLLFKLRLYTDYISYYWTKFVINYDFNMQLSLVMGVKSGFKSINFSFEKWRNYFYIILTIILIAVLVLSKTKKVNDNNIYIKKFYGILRQKGVNIDESDSLVNNLERIKDPELKRVASFFVNDINKMLFKDNKIVKNTLQKDLKDIKQLKKYRSEVWYGSTGCGSSKYKD
ncbi:MAG: DUF3488 and transglutaminase-like domain-containing protein [Deferribacterales bacterium]